MTCRCSIQAVPAEAVAIAARDAAPALEFTHRMLRRPGGGKGRKQNMAAKADAAGDGQCTAQPVAAGDGGAQSATGADGGESTTDRAAATAAAGAAAGEAAAGGAAGPTADSPPPTAFRQLTRLTFAAVEAGQAQMLAQRSEVARSYDIVAIQPLSERVLQQVCNPGSPS